MWRGAGLGAASLVLAYYVGANETHYSFATSELRNVRYDNIDLAIGYSKLDYLAKCENNYFGPIADVTIAAGLSIANFAAIATPAGDVSDALALHLRGNLQLSWRVSVMCARRGSCTSPRTRRCP